MLQSMAMVGPRVRAQCRLNLVERNFRALITIGMNVALNYKKDGELKN